jgi:hypothetical protein
MKILGMSNLSCYNAKHRLMTAIGVSNHTARGHHMAKNILTRERLCTLLEADTEAGVFRWKNTMGGKAIKGQIAGAKNAAGYIVIRVDKTDQFAHRLMWLYVYGAIPLLNIDHIDRDRANNKPVNLRLATPKQNSENIFRAKTNTSGFRGVRKESRLKSKPWSATITHNYKQKHLGYFATAEEAVEARKKAEDLYFTHHKVAYV